MLGIVFDKCGAQGRLRDGAAGDNSSYRFSGFDGFRPQYPPMEAKSANEIPAKGAYLFEPKWDGFRCLAFRSRGNIVLQSKAGQPLGLYFQEGESTSLQITT